MQSIRTKLAKRATAKQAIRNYFAKHGVLEVDTGLIAAFSVTDPYMSALSATDEKGKQIGFLQTSPEYTMKKLLCQGSGDIYQLDKAFRADETGPNHRVEFTLLEWYRLGWNEYELVDEVIAIIELIVGNMPVKRLTYRDAFMTHLNADPFNISTAQIKELAREKLGDLPSNLLKDDYLTLLFATQVETQFNAHELTVVSKFPASQAALAQVADTEYGQVGRRFEVYGGGLELANGFYELTDPAIQLERFEKDNQTRRLLNKAPIEIDVELIASLKQGLPECAGVALGFDRLLMLAMQTAHIEDVVAQPSKQDGT